MLSDDYSTRDPGKAPQKGVIYMEEITMIALGPFYAMGVGVTAWVLYALAHKAAKMDESATETRDVETVPAKN